MKFFLILVLFFSINSVKSQSDFYLEKKLDYKADFITIDALGNLYIINGSKIKKIDLKNNFEQDYSNTLFGNINSLDAIDPFKTLVFYREFNRIEFLNKDFSSIASPIQLDDLGYYNVSSVCQSVNGGFWVFDQSLSQLVYFDQNRKPAMKSSQLSSLIAQDIEQKQIFMLEKNDYIYLGIRGEGVLLFDSYGTYIKTFPLKNISAFQVKNGIISFFNKGELKLYNTSDYSESKIGLPEHNCKQVLIEKNKLFILTDKEIFIYQSNN